MPHSFSALSLLWPGLEISRPQEKRGPQGEDCTLWAHPCEHLQGGCTSPKFPRSSQLLVPFLPEAALHGASARVGREIAPNSHLQDHHFMPLHPLLRNGHVPGVMVTSPISLPGIFVEPGFFIVLPGENISLSCADKTPTKCFC